MTRLCTDFLDYFPIRHGLAPSQIGLRRLSSYQEIERKKIFQFGNDWPIALECKRRARAERLGKYYQRESQENLADTEFFIVQTLVTEYPEWFSLTGDAQDYEWHAAHTGDRLRVKNGRLDLTQSLVVSFANPVDLFDALAMQVPEDLVVQNCSEDYRTSHCAALHLCHANGWSAEWAIGKSFDAIHARVPRIETIVRDSSKMLKAIVEAPSPMERVGAVNFVTNAQLNQHPDIPIAERHAPFVSGANSQLFLRFERQCTVGFATARRFLFTIRTYFTEISPEMPADKWQAFGQCLKNPLPESNAHRFLTQNQAELEKWYRE